MLRRIRLLTCVIAISFVVCHDAQEEENCRRNASCGDLLDIQYPFRLRTGSGVNCPRYPAELSCEDNRTTLTLFNAKYYVKAPINYKGRKIHAVDPGLLNYTCPFRPRNWLTSHNFSQHPCGYYRPAGDYDHISFFDCLSPIESPDYVKINCSTTNSSAATTSYSYIMVKDGVDNLQPSCNLTGIVISYGITQVGSGLSFSFIRDHLRRGIELYWDELLPNNYQSVHCSGENMKRDLIEAAKIIGLFLMARMILAFLFCSVSVATNCTGNCSQSMKQYKNSCLPARIE
ncbi:hypothetical protein ACFX2H_033513 [Malus domestica]